MKQNKLWIFITIGNFLAMFIAILKLPDRVPIHVNIAMKVDGWGSKWYLLLLACIPVIMVISYDIYRKKAFSNGKINRNEKVENIMVPLVSLILMMAIWMCVIIASQYDIPADATVPLPFHLMILLPLGIMMIVLGNYMGTIKYNKHLGIRTP